MFALLFCLLQPMNIWKYGWIGFACKWFCSSCNSNLVLLFAQTFVIMTSRIVTVTGMSGHLLDLELPRGDIFCKEVMREIKHEVGIRMCDQRIICGGAVLSPLNILPSEDDDLILTLVRVKAMCGKCGRRRRRKHLFRCSACPGVAYCDSACQRADWINHRAICWKYKDECEWWTYCVNKITMPIEVKDLCLCNARVQFRFVFAFAGKLQTDLMGVVFVMLKCVGGIWFAFTIDCYLVA